MKGKMSSPKIVHGGAKMMKMPMPKMPTKMSKQMKSKMSSMMKK